MEPHTRLLEQAEGMPAASGVRQAKDRTQCLVDDELGLQRMALFLARVVATLFLGGGGALHGRFRRVDEDDLIRSVAGDEGFLARKRERPTLDGRVLAPADVAIGRTLTASIAVPNVEIRTIFPPVLQRCQRRCYKSSHHRSEKSSEH